MVVLPNMTFSVKYQCSTPALSQPLVYLGIPIQFLGRHCRIPTSSAVEYQSSPPEFAPKAKAKPVPAAKATPAEKASPPAAPPQAEPQLPMGPPGVCLTYQKYFSVVNRKTIGNRSRQIAYVSA